MVIDVIPYNKLSLMTALRDTTVQNQLLVQLTSYNARQEPTATKRTFGLLLNVQVALLENTV